MQDTLIRVLLRASPAGRGARRMGDMLRKAKAVLAEHQRMLAEGDPYIECLAIEAGCSKGQSRVQYAALRELGFAFEPMGALGAGLYWTSPDVTTPEELASLGLRDFIPAEGFGGFRQCYCFSLGCARVRASTQHVVP